MPYLILEASMYLLRAEWLIHQGRVRALHEALNGSRTIKRDPVWTANQICHAMDVACVLYFKTVLCLQRSAATTFLLRHHGYSAALVIGARIVPFRSHAWVELDQTVVNDKSYVPELYRELERCCPKSSKECL